MPIHQLCTSIELGKNWKLVSLRIDKSSCPNRNLVGITEKGKEVTERLKDFFGLISLTER